ncbi:NYN domain-containing protein [Microgenomates group bacterium]|nr:NYN domain-containing protein [Microgenomates group bacterium]
MSYTKTVAFIDAANIIYGAKKTAGFKVDLLKLANYLKTRFKTAKIYFYGGVNTKKIDFEKYYQLLESFGFIPRLKKTKFYYQPGKIKIYICRFCRRKNLIKERGKFRPKANCDVDLSIDVLESLEKFNRFVFLTGDGDFEPLLIKAKKLNKEVYVIASSRKTARNIKKAAAEKFVEIKSLEKIIAKKKEATLLKSQPPVFVKNITHKK